MADFSYDELVQKCLDIGILTQEQVNDIWRECGSKSVDCELFLQIALRRGYLTNYQVDRINEGEGKGFFFGNYKVLYHVGAGTFARVFRTVHRVTGSVAAVKVLRARFSDRPEVVNHFLNEAKLVSTLKHPNIVPVYGAESKGFLHYMAMEFVEGQTLREFVKIRRTIDPKTVIQIGIDVCSALDYALKTQKLPHRDLKLSNVMLSTSGQAKLVDFGLAAIAQGGAGDEVPFLRNQQSVDYIALEKASGAPRMDNRSDLYFLGVVMYHLLGGVSPFEETKDKAKRMDRNRFFNVKPLQQIAAIPASVAFLVNKAITVNPDQRYQTAGEMLVELRGVMKRLESGADDESSIASLRHDGLQALQGDRQERILQLTKATVMIVDSNPKTQKGLETLMQKLGYDTVSVQEPDDIYRKFSENDLVAQCIVFNGQSLGMRAVRAFNDFAQRRGFRDVAAILILNQGQADWAEQVTPQHHRIVLIMPVTVRQFKESKTWLLQGFGKET